MKEIATKGHAIKLYDSIDEMPIVNFQKYNKFILIDSGLGSDIDSVDSHLVNLAKLIKTDMAKASRELQNLRQTMHMIVSGISPKYLAFAALIHSIDGEVLTDLSDDGLKNVLNRLNDIKHNKIVEFLTRLKKKLDTELETYFPNEFGNDAKEKEVYDKLKQKTLLKLDEIINDNDNSEQINEIESFLFSLYKPKNFYGKDSVEIKYDKQFETACMYISQETNMNAKSMTVLEFYNTMSELKKQAELKAKAYKKH
jgi:hypothetical protein|nr:MAG TPA: hypothetical protein [Caudoviricetes sp.]